MVWRRIRCVAGTPCRDGSLSMTMMKRVMPAMVTIAVLALIARRVPVDRLIASLRDANYVAFLAVMIPNTIVYFLWDTLILKTVVGWFHGGHPLRGLLAGRGGSYGVAFLHTHARRGAPAAQLWRPLARATLGARRVGA